MNKNVILAIVAVVLLILSIISYSGSVAQAERFEKGQKFLPNLNPDEISQIELTKGDDVTLLQRDGDSFVVASQHDYPAKNESVNRFITDLLDLGLEKRVGSGEALDQELEVTPGGESTIEIRLKNASDKEMVHLTVGKALENGSGSFVKRLDGPDHDIYLTTSRLHINADASNYLKKQMINLAQADIMKIEGGDFVIADENGSLKLQKIPAGKKEKTSETGQVKSAFSYLNFDQVFLADAPEVSDLKFQPALSVELKNKTGYRMALAERGDAVYAKIEGFHHIDIQANVSITQDSSEEELKEKSENLSLIDDIKQFNQLHGSWVYQLSEFAAKKFQKTKQDLLEDEKSED